MNILFVIGELGYIDPLGVAFLSAVAKRRGHKTHFCSLDRDDLLVKLEQTEPQVVAYSAYTADIDKFRSLNAMARNKRSFISIVGGPHATFSSAETLDSGFDACAIGEAEETFDEFLSRIEVNQPFDDIEGLVTPGQPIPQVRRLNEDLDTLPMPDRDLVLSSTIIGQTSKKTFFTSRGCPFQCTYCLNPALQKIYKGRGKYIRRFSVDRVLDEILLVKSRYRLDFVKFDDDVFALKPDAWLVEFADKYPGKVGLPFNCLIRLDKIDEELVRLLKQAGCHSATTSIDSASETVRKEILNRRMSNEQMVSSLQLLHRYGINTFVNFIIDLPGATISDELASIDLAREAQVSYLSYTFLTLFPGTKIRETCLEHGIIDDNYRAPMSMLDEPTLTNSPEEKRIRKNVLDLGHIAMVSPEGVKQAIVEVIKTSPHNKSFTKLRQDAHRYYMENVIYRCSDGINME